jgi:hypothetical protein
MRDPQRMNHRCQTGQFQCHVGVHEIRHHCRQNVRRTQGLRNEPGIWLLVRLSGCADLCHAGVLHDPDLVCHGECFFLVVSDEDEGGTGLFLQAYQRNTGFRTQIAVQRREWFVEQQQA